MVKGYRRIRLGANRPTGWIAQCMEADLRTGWVGHLDKLAPRLFADNIYGTDRRTSRNTAPDVGALTGADHANSSQFLWWNAETQSNWRNGWVRHALLVGNETERAAAKDYAYRMLATQDADGYLGIYDPALRFRTTGENGELWAQTTLLRTLLAYAQATQDLQVVDAVLRAAACTRDQMGQTGWQPFDQPGGFAGVSHGLMWVDVLEQLARITGDSSWLDLAVALYQNYSASTVSETDAQQANLLNSAKPLQGHGAHTWEHLRAVALVAAYAQAPALQDALQAFLEKIDSCLTPSGGPIGDEWIASRAADASETGYEYCSIVELFDSYQMLLDTTGDMQWADRAEHLFFNAALGARHPGESSIAYLKTDNSFSMTGVKHLDRPQADDAFQTRYRYSPVHQEAAVCCVPNAGRLFPSYVQTQYRQVPDGLVLVLYGPSIVQWNFQGQDIEVEQRTTFPHALSVRLVVHTQSPAQFVLRLRRPVWAQNVCVDASSEALTWDGDATAVHGTWSGGDAIDIHFDARMQIKYSRQGEVFFQKGPLVYALPIADQTRTTRLWPQSVFREIDVRPINASSQSLELPHDFAQRLIDANGALSVPLIDTNGIEQLHVLVPMKETVLRRVTFKVREPNTFSAINEARSWNGQTQCTTAQ